MKNKTVKALALAMAVATVTMMGSASIYASDDTAEAATEETADTEEDADDDQAAADEVTTLSDTSDDTAEETADTEEDADAADTAEASDDDQKAADEVAALIDKIYVQERNDTTDEDCKAAKEAWDKLTDAQKALVEGEEASPEYFGADTGDASKDDPRNQDEIGENELLVVSFGTSFNDSRAQDIKGIEDKLQEAYPDWSVRRAFTAQIIINHVEARDDEVIDNMDQALDRAVANGVKNLVVQPTHLMHGAEYDEMVEALDSYKDKFESVAIAEPMLGEVGDDATVINDDKKAVAQAITDEACKIAGYDSMEAAAEDGNERAMLALKVFAHKVRFYIGAYIAEMNGVDAIIFTAGVGENDIAMRDIICNDLGNLGIKLDVVKNKVRGKEMIISREDSKVKVLLIPTNEELMIARDTFNILTKGQA